MRPKRNVPSHRVSPTQQPMRSSQVRRVEEVQYAAVSSPSGSHRARPPIDPAGGPCRGLSKGFTRRDFAPTLVDSLARRPGATPGGSRCAGRTDTLFLAIAEQRPLFKKNVTTKIGPPSTYLPSGASKIYNPETPRTRNTSFNGVHPDRTRNQHKSNTRNISGRSQGLHSQTQSKCRSTKKMLSKKSHLLDISINDNVSRVPSSDKMCLVAQLQNTLGMAVSQAEESEEDMHEINENGSSNTEQPQPEVFSVTSFTHGTLPLKIQESKSNHCSDKKDSIEHINVTTSTTDNFSLVEGTPLQKVTPESTQKGQISPDDSSRGWERVLLSLQVQMSPLTSPSASSAALENGQYVSHSYSCKTNRTFQTTSEILVLPIFTRQRHCHSNWISNKTCDTVLGQRPIGNALMKEILECKNYELDNDISSVTSVNPQNISEMQTNFATEKIDTNMDALSVALTHHEQNLTCVSKIDYSATREMCENGNVSKNFLNQHSDSKVSKLDSGKNVQNDLTPICSYKEDTTFSSENIVTELQLNQNDIVKMAYEIIEIVSKIHENKNHCSQTSEKIKNDLNTFRRGRSADVILKHSESNVPSARTARSLKNLDTNTRKNISETTSETIELFENGVPKWCPDEKTLNYPSSKVDSDATDDENGNGFKLPKSLPVLLFQNKQVHKILKHFVSKLEEHDQRSHDLHKSSSGGILEVNMNSPKDEASKSEGDTHDFKPECKLESKEQQFNEFIDLKEYPELGVKISEHEKVDFSVNVCMSDNKANAILHDKSVAYDESNASEVDTEKSVGVDSEAGAEDGDDEATASASESVEEQENTNVASSNDPSKTPACICREKENVCPRHPAQNEEDTPEGTCQCERFQELCTESQAPIATTSKAESEKQIPEETDNVTKNQRRSSHTGASITSSSTKSGSWIPWVKESDSGPRIPDFNPSADPNISDNVSTVTLQPHLVQNTMNLLENRDQELSIWGSGGNIPPWIPSGVRDDEVPDTITEFHWMPDDLRGFSSTIIYPEIPDDLQPYPAEERPLLYKPQSTPDSSLSGLVIQTSPRKISDNTKVVINPDAPAEVPHGAISASLDVAVGGTFFDVLANTMEKSISPLKSAIDDLKTKIDRLETAHIASMRPDILVGVTSVPTCSARSGQSNGSDEQGTSCVPPFGLYILHQRSSLAGNAVPLSATQGSATENAAPKYYIPGKSPLPCVRCVDKMQTISPSFIDNSPNLVENSESVRPPTPFLAPSETGGGGGGGGGGANDPPAFSVSENSKTVSQPQLPPSNGQGLDRCICKSIDKFESSEKLEQSLTCPQCNKCSPSQILVNSPEGCDTCCNQPGNGENQSPLEGGNLQNPSEHKVCGTCKTCISNVVSFESPGVPRPPYVNIPCYRCCNGPVLRRMPRDYPWHRLKNCPGCAQCPFPPPCPPCPPPKPKLSPIAQMYLDMSRAKYDWSDISARKKEDQSERAHTKMDICEPESKPDEKTESEVEERPEGEFYEVSENFADQLVDTENMENIDSQPYQGPEEYMLDDNVEGETAQDFEIIAEEPVSIEGTANIETTKEMDDKPTFTTVEFPCACPRDYCIPPKNLQCEETKSTKITDEELVFRKINHPCVCPTDYCVPPETSQQEPEEAPQEEENVPFDDTQNSPENLEPDTENQPT